MEEIEEFKKAMEPAIEWFMKNCNPHQQIRITNDGVELVSIEMFSPIEITD